MIARALLVAAILGVGAAAAAESPDDYAYRLPLTATGDAAFVSVELPDIVYEGVARADLRDIRVFNADGSPVGHAFLPRPATTRAAAGSASLPLFPLRVDVTRNDLSDVDIKVRKDAARTTIDLATRDGKPVAAQRLAGYLVDATDVTQPIVALTLPFASATNVTTRIQIEASDDLTAWRPVVVDAPLVDLEFAGRHLVRNRVDVPRTAAKYLRLTWLAGQPALELAGVAAEYGERIGETERQWRSVEGTSVADKPGEFEFDLRAALPVDRVTLELPELNTVAPARLSTRATPSDPWRPVGSAVFYRLRETGGEIENPSIAVAVASRYWLVQIDPKSGGVGAKPPRLAAGWHPHVIVFAARGSAPFVLAYGNARATPSALPIETLVPGYDRSRDAMANVVAASIGEAVVGAGSGALREPTDIKRWALWSVLVAASLLLAWMAVRLSRQMGERPKHENDNANGDANGDAGETRR